MQQKLINRYYLVSFVFSEFFVNNEIIIDCFLGNLSRCFINDSNDWYDSILFIINV